VVDVRERHVKPEIVQKDIPCDIVAKESGLITSLIAREGQPVVKKDELVEKGDVLISHSIPITYSENSRHVHASGEVYARVWRTVRTATPLNVLKKHYTGRVRENWSLIFGTKRINILLNSSNLHTECDKIKEQYYLQIGSVQLPVCFVREICSEYESERCVLAQESAAACSVDAANRLLADLQQGSAVRNLRTDSVVENGVLVTTVTNESVIQIGMEQTVESLSDPGQ